MIIFNVCRIENGKIYYFGRFVGVVKGIKVLVFECFWCREFECFFEELGFVLVWVLLLLEVKKVD